VIIMLKRLPATVLAVAFWFIPLQVFAQGFSRDYSDIWYLPSESGWGVNIVQAQTFIFATFFVYGSDNRPTWYTAQMQEDANGNFAGPLYSFLGTYLGAPWVPTNLMPTTAGTAAFVPTSPYQGTLTYSINSGPTVVKSIQRQTLTTIGLGDNYIGGIEGGYANSNGTCSVAGGYADTYNLTVTQPGDGTVSLQFNYVNAQVTCTFAGTLVQYGQLYSIPNASYTCSNGFSTTANLDQIKATAQGIEGTYFAPSEPGNCSESATFSAVLL
jgi:hypothetical protein